MFIHKHCILVLATCAVLNQVRAGGTQQRNAPGKQGHSNPQTLDDLSAAYQLDKKCHVLDSAEREGLRDRIDSLRTAAKASRGSLGRDKSINELPCNGKVARRLFNMARAVTDAEPLNSDAANRSSHPVVRTATQTKEQQALILFWLVRDVDTRCHAYTARERETLDTQIKIMLKSQNLTDERMKALIGASPQDPCNEMGTVMLIRIVQGYIHAVVAPAAPATPKQDKDTAAWQAIQKSWQDNFSSLPNGRLAAFEGCWNGNLNGTLAVLCLANQGDQATFLLGSAGTTNCRFTEGGARKRGEYILFFAASETQQCIDATQIQHAEGGCKPATESSMECTLSVYAKGNTFYQTTGGKEMNGTITMSRGPAVLR